ncbi:hypothetical protein M0651_21570 [Paenibacillus sp. MBLB2552]|uniref:Uncharacterized protein n=1 Tax=Paenibacillus mellifer TaxID=2937794 RepID=A0A9X1Y3B1_9BACL|nr:hypothetical protein [Paenibacillus mellifer]MCK8489763.1 hypothetical protein [Paenibacillus mellifer]
MKNRKMVIIIGIVLLSIVIFLYFSTSKIMDYLNSNTRGSNIYVISMGYNLNDETFTFTDSSSEFINRNGIKILIEFPEMSKGTHHGRLLVKELATSDTVMEQHVHITKGMSGQVVQLTSAGWSTGKYKCIFEIDNNQLASKEFILK